MTGFKHAAVKELTDQQVRFAPPAKRREQQARAEKLLTEIDASKQYPYQYICFRVTEFRPESYADLLIDGADLQHDLRVMVAALAIVTLEEISKRWNVSTKTIRRWGKPASISSVFTKALGPTWTIIVPSCQAFPNASHLAPTFIRKT